MTLGIWGGALGGAGMLFLSSVPIFQHDVLMKIPFVASYFEGELCTFGRRGFHAVRCTDWALL